MNLRFRGGFSNIRKRNNVWDNAIDKNCDNDISDDNIKTAIMKLIKILNFGTW